MLSPLAGTLWKISKISQGPAGDIGPLSPPERGKRAVKSSEIHSIYACLWGSAAELRPVRWLLGLLKGRSLLRCGAKEPEETGQGCALINNDFCEAIEPSIGHLDLGLRGLSERRPLAAL